MGREEARTTVLVADDHEVFLEGLVLLLERDPRIAVVGTARDGAEVVESALALRPDLVLVDLVMPGIDGLGATRRIVEVDPDAVVVVMSGAEKDAEAQALQAGATAFLTKDEDIGALPGRLVEIAGRGRTRAPAGK